MKFVNGIFLDEKFMATVAKCNEYEDWSQRELTGSIGWSKNYDQHKKIMMIPETN